MTFPPFPPAPRPFFFFRDFPVAFLFSLWPATRRPEGSVFAPAVMRLKVRRKSTVSATERKPAEPLGAGEVAIAHKIHAVGLTDRSINVRGTK